MYSPKEAGNAVGKSKSAILKAIKTRKISATRDDNGNFQIDPAELHRVYPPKPKDAPERAGDKVAGKGSTGTLERAMLELDHLEARIGTMMEERERERRQAQETIDDLRARLDREAEDRRALQGRLLTDERKPRGIFGIARKRSA